MQTNSISGSYQADSGYFKTLGKALHEAAIAQPVLLIDKQKLDRNLGFLKQVLDKGFDYRIVAKSLPSVPLLKYIMAQTGTNKLMCFHLPFLKYLIQEVPNADILLGKPMTTAGLRQFYTSLDESSAFDPATKLQWLVDSDERLADYESLAAELNIVLNVNFEVDIGLHRGGYANEREFVRSLQRVQNSRYLSFSGLMGYEAHITKIPALLGGPKKAEHEAKKRYRRFAELVKNELGDRQDLCLNMGGSTTYPLYYENDLCTELAAASALVKPSDFDVYTLAHHQPAAFIATPILKTVKKPVLPMTGWLSEVMRFIGLLPRQACFIYGGNWLANPVFPSEMKRVELFGHSSNQEMYALPEGDWQAGDFVFFRPTQSEAVFLQFGQIALYDEGSITEWWPVFSYPEVTTENNTVKTLLREA